MTGGEPASRAAQAATTAIPIVFATGGDPVQFGFVTSLNRPGGNITGISFLVNALVSKRLELLRELVPTVTMIAFLVNPTARATEANTKEAQKAARLLGLRLVVLNASSERDFDAVFSTLVQQRAGALVINPDALFTSHPINSSR